MVEQSGSSHRRARQPRQKPASGEAAPAAPSARRSRAKGSDGQADPTIAAKVEPKKARARPRARPGGEASSPAPDSAASAVAERPAAKPKKRWNPITAYVEAGEKLLTRMRKEKVVTAADVIREIETGPKGPQVIAAFDFDRTLVAGLTGVMLFQERMKRKEIKRTEVADTLSSSLKTMTRKMEGHEAIARGFIHWAGKTEEEMEELAEHLFVTKIQDIVYPEMREVLAAHRQAGHTIVVATAATRFQVQRAVDELGVDNLLCTEVEIVDGKLTGRLIGESLFGPGKIAALKRFIAEHGCDFADTHFYGDGDEEIELMAMVGHPHPVNPTRKLSDAAKAKGWPVLRLQSRGGEKPGNYLRGIRGLLSIMPIAPAGLAVGLMTRDRRQVGNLLLPTWIQRQLDLAGVKLRVSGRKNLRARRPAVFIFNHRNNHDGMFAAVLVRNDVAGIGKKEIGQNPIGKLGSMIVPTVLVERGGGDANKAAEALKPLLEAVENGYSIMLAPEGTRVRGHHNSVGSFKKGAFHLAMAAGIPLVPIVIRNALDVASRDGPMRPGTVDVAVLPPVPVDDWTKENMAEKIEQVRQMFIDTLNHWPDPDPADAG